MTNVTPECACGCGLPVAIAKRTNKTFGHVAGQPVKFRTGHNSRRVPKSRYRQVYRPEHISANSSGCVFEHIYLAEVAIGRKLPASAEVHHVDGNSLNNHRTNLVICQDNAYHKLLHARGHVLEMGGNPNTQKFCHKCSSLKSFSEFKKNLKNKTTGLLSQCIECSLKRYNVRNRARSLARRLA